MVMRACPQCGTAFQQTRSNHLYCSRSCQTKARYSGGTLEGKTHLVIPDTQVEPGRPIDHLEWIGRYCQDRYGDKQLTRIHLGDHWNMGSLSSYDRGKGKMEGRRVQADIEAGNKAFALLGETAPLWDDHLLLGNHEWRIARAIESDIQLEGLLSLDALDSNGWEVHDFLDPLWLDGVAYAHYFYNPMTGRPYAGANVETRLKTIGHSFTMGHQQGFGFATRYVGGHEQIGMVAGSCYLHDEDYLGYQGNHCWRGIIVCNNVEDGAWDLMRVSLDYLCRRYEGVRLRDYEPRRFA
jgi:hypothetical protein